MYLVFTPHNYAPLYHALLANGNIHLFVSTNRSSPPISWPITARLRFKPGRLRCDPAEPGSEHRGALCNMIQVQLLIPQTFCDHEVRINQSRSGITMAGVSDIRSVLSSLPQLATRLRQLPRGRHLRPNDTLNESLLNIIWAHNAA